MHFNNEIVQRSWKLETLKLPSRKEATQSLPNMKNGKAMGNDMITQDTSVTTDIMQKFGKKSNCRKIRKKQ